MSDGQSFTILLSFAKTAVRQITIPNQPKCSSNHIHFAYTRNRRGTTARAQNRALVRANLNATPSESMIKSNQKWKVAKCANNNVFARCIY